MGQRACPVLHCSTICGRFHQHEIFLFSRRFPVSSIFVVNRSSQESMSNAFTRQKSGNVSFSVNVRGRKCNDCMDVKDTTLKLSIGSLVAAHNVAL